MDAMFQTQTRYGWTPLFDNLLNIAIVRSCPGRSTIWASAAKGRVIL